MKLSTNEIARLTKNLTDFYMGELVPQADAIRGYYDHECWEVCNPCTMYRDGRSCVECRVEYVGAMKYMGEHMLAAHITEYVGNGQFSRSTEYWNCNDVRRFKNEIIINL